MDKTPSVDRDDDAVQLDEDWTEKDGAVENDELEEVLPQGEPVEGPAPLP